MRRHRVALAIIVVVALGITVPTVGLAAGAAGESKPGVLADMTKFLRGELLKVDGSTYIVKDSSGKEFRLMVDSHTTLVGNFQPGAKVEAQITADGYAISIRQVKG
jgi:hypothetical protein